MKLLLINPNRYQSPPVIPLALEYLAGALDGTHHQVEVVDLCFTESPYNKLHGAITSFQPDVAGLTIRQLDTALYPNNQCFINDIKTMVNYCHQHKLKVILGGSGFSIIPRKLLEYTQADYGITGPGENALPALLNKLESGNFVPKITGGYSFFRENSCYLTRKRMIDYTSYIHHDGIVGFRTQIGCPENCFFCIEGQNPVIYHEPDIVSAEIKALKQEGYQNFHLCDSEFNIHLPHSKAICRAIIQKAGKIEWSAYMKPEPFSEELFELMQQSGVQSITLSIDTLSYPPSTHKKIEPLFRMAAKQNIQIMVDLSVGAPYENPAHSKAMIEFLDKQPVVETGVNAYYRVYPSTPLHHQIQQDPKLQEKLISEQDHQDFLFPVFFNHISKERIAEWIQGKSKFRIEGFDKKAVNYQRLKQ